MYNAGDYIQQLTNGLCRVEKVTTLDFAKTDKDRLYYILTPLDNPKTTVFIPIEKAEGTARPVMNTDEAVALIDDMPDIEALQIPKEREREICYKKALLSLDSHSWVSLIKTLYQRRQDRLSQGKKGISMEDQYYRKVEDRLYGEIALVLDKDKEEMERFIFEKIEGCETHGNKN